MSRRVAIAGLAALLSLASLASFATGCSRKSAEPAPSGPTTTPIPPSPAPTDTGTAPSALPPGHPTPEDTTPKEAQRLLPGETYIRTYLQIFGGLTPLDAQKALAGADGTALFDTWDDYLGALGLPDYRFDVPRQQQSNALMMATFERVGVALCDRALEHDRTKTPRLVYDFDMPASPTKADFTSRFDKMHRLFLSYRVALAPTDRVTRFFDLYTQTAASHAAPAGDAGTASDAGTAASRFKPNEAGWAAVCYGLVRHPEFHLY